MEQLHPGIINGVQPGSRGAFPRKSPSKDTTWHHTYDKPGSLQLMTTKQHQEKGNMQKILHPGLNKSGGMQQWGI